MAERGVRDLTTGPITRTLILFTLPTLGSNILQSLNGSINTIWVGRFLGERALAATSNANLILFLSISAVFGFAMAATILIGQGMGRRDVDLARRAVGTALGGFGGLAILVAGLGWWFTPEILALLATPPEVTPLAEAYLRVIFLSVPGFFGQTILMMSLRGVGDSMTPLYIMILGVLLDSGLNPVFILGLGPAPEMGIAGSATATLVSSYVSFAVQLVVIYARDLPIRLRGAELRYLIPARDLLRFMLGKGLPMGLQMIVLSASGMVMMGLVNRNGAAATAGYGIALQLWTYIQMPAFAIGAAVSAMAAQNIGAGKWERVGRITRSGLIANVGVTGIVVVILLLFDRPAMLLFLGHESPAIDIARHIQMIGSWSFVLFGASMVLFATMRANGAAIGPLVVLVIAVLPVRLGFAAAVRPTLGMDALWWSFPIGSLAALAGAIGLYLHGGWRKARVVPGVREAKEHAKAGADPAGRMNPAG